MIPSPFRKYHSRMKKIEYIDQGAKIKPSILKEIETRTLCHERPVAYPGEEIIVSTVIQVGRAKKRIAVPVVIVGSRTIL